MKEPQYIQDYKEAVLAMKSFEDHNEEFRTLRERLQTHHFKVFFPEDMDKKGKLKQAHEINEWLRTVDFEYF